MKKITLFALVSLLAFVATGFQCGNKYNITDAANEAAHRVGITISRELSQTTPQGAIHYGKFNLTNAQLDLIDTALDRIQVDAATDGFRDIATKPHGFYEVYTPPYACVLSPEQRIPSFMTNGGYFYDGTEYDQYNSKGPATPPYRDPDNGNWIIWKKDMLSAVFAAEQVFGIGTPGSTSPHGQMLVCPDLSVLENAVKHGAEHIWLANFPYTEEWRLIPPYDVWEYFNGTLLHVTGTGHPLLPRQGRLADLAGRLGAGTLANGPKPSIVTETPVPQDLRDKLASRGVELGAGDLIAVSSTTIIRAVK